MKQGDLVLVPFPFTNLRSIKTRPALIISKKSGDDDVIVLAITSQKQIDTVKIDNKDLSGGALPLTSFVRYGKVVALHKSLIKKSVGTLKTEILNNVISKFKEQF